VFNIIYRDKKVVGVFVRFHNPSPLKRSEEETKAREEGKDGIYQH
jgi:hypothetical protein